MAPLKFGKLEQEFQNPYAAYKQDPNPHNTSQLLNSLRPVISSGVRQHVGQENPISTSQARRLTLQALKTYDPNKAKLATHVHNHLQGLRRITRQQMSGVRIPERLSLDQRLLSQSENELQEQLGREPTALELADHSRLSVKRIAKLRKVQPGVASGTLSSGDVENSWDPAVIQPRTDSWLRLVHADQDPIGQKILEWSFGLYGSPRLKNQEIAQRLRLTPGAVSQRKAKLQQVLDQQQLTNF